jgi:BASS family bile acid:Na+ symporter
MFERLLLLWLSILCAIAFAWPQLGAALGFDASFDPFDASRPWVKTLISITMFLVGCLLQRREVRDILARFPLVIGGTAIQYTAMPILGFLCAWIFPLSPEYRLAVIMAGCVPGAMASNVVTLAGRGNVSYSVSLTTCSTVLSPIVVPIALWLALGVSSSLNPWDCAWELVLQVAGPVLIGFGICQTVPRFEHAMRRVAPVAANLTILWVIAVVVGLNRERLSQAFHSPAADLAPLLAALLAMNLLGYLAGWIGGIFMGIDIPMRRALTIEIGMQNAGLGTSLILTLFKDQPTAAIPTALYTFGCMFTGTLMAQIWSHLDDRAARRAANSPPSADAARPVPDA